MWKDILLRLPEATSKLDVIRIPPENFLSFGATVPSRPEPPHSQDFYITHNDASRSVGLLWTSDQLVAESST